MHSTWTVRNRCVGRARYIRVQSVDEIGHVAVRSRTQADYCRAVRLRGRDFEGIAVARSTRGVLKQRHFARDARPLTGLDILVQPISDAHPNEIRFGIRFGVRNENYCKSVAES